SVLSGDPQVFQYLAGRVATRDARHPAAGVATRPAEIEPLDREAIGGTPEHRAPGEELIQPHVRVGRVATGEGEAISKVGRRYDVSLHHGGSDPRGVLLEHLENEVAEPLLLRLPA